MVECTPGTTTAKCSRPARSSPFAGESDISPERYAEFIPASEPERPAATDTPFEKPRMQQIGVSNQDTKAES